MSVSTREWDIRYPDGKLAATHVRIQDGKSKRMYWVGNDTMHGLPGISVSDLPLYRSEVISQRNADVVVLTEGEKSADAVAAAIEPKPGRLIAAAAGTVTGASATPGDAALSVLAGRLVVLWPDADDVGVRHMERIRDRLRGVALGVYRIDWRGFPQGGDAADVPPEVIRAMVSTPIHWW